MKHLLVSVIAFTLFVGCTAYRVKEGGPPRTRVYPDGVYKHSVLITLPDGSLQRFQGVVSLGEKEIIVVGLSAFQTTAFRIKDDLTADKLQVEIFAMPLKRYEAKLREFYRLLRKVFLLPLKELPAEPMQLTAETKLFFEEYDSHQIPLRVKIEGGKFDVEIKVTGYEI
jgi:hypothetical protein